MAMGVLPTVLPALMDNLFDQCWSIREDAAMALASMAGSSSLQSSILPVLLAQLRSSLMQAEKSPTQSREEAQRLMNDPKAHTGHELVGCCGGSTKSHTGPCHKASHRRYVLSTTVFHMHGFVPWQLIVWLRHRLCSVL